MRNAVRISRNIDALTGIRAFLIVWIILYHLQEELALLLPWPPLLNFAATGFVGVDFFFILSGFVIAYNYAPRFRVFKLPTYGRFLWLRLARIYPTHLFTLALAVLMFVAAKASGSALSNPDFYTFSGWVQNLLLVQAWHLPTVFTWNAVAWAVSSEWLAYLLFPLIIAATLRIRSPLQNLGTLLVLLWTMAAVCQWLERPQPAEYGAGSYGLLRLAGEFVAGCLLYNLYKLRWGDRWQWANITSLIWPVAVISLTLAATPNIISNQLAPWLGVPNELSALWLTPLCALAIYAIAQEKGVLVRLLSTKPLLQGGQLSYALYLTHFLCLIALRRALPLSGLSDINVVVGLGGLCGYLAVMGAVAIATYYLVGAPSRRWMRQFFSAERTTLNPKPSSHTIAVQQSANQTPSHETSSRSNLDSAQRPHAGDQ